jgi:hypothetical protein
MFKYCFRKKDYGLMAFACGLGIILGIILPVWGWMIGCGLGLIVGGIIWIKE